MPDEYKIKFHPNFFKDLKNLNKKDIKTVHKQINKIEKNPIRFKHLHGKENCYAVRVGGLRIVYYLAGKIIWFLVVEKRKKVYTIYFKRLYKIKEKME